MTILQQTITIILCALGTMLTRFLPFLVFNPKKPTPKYIQYLELIAIAVTISLHLWKRQMLLSIAGGTVCYMLLVQFVF